MLRHELTESLISNRKEKSHDGDEDLRRLRRKIVPSLPEQQVEVENHEEEKQGFLRPFNPQSSFITVWNVINIFLIYLYFLQIPIALTFGEDHRQGNEEIFQQINYPCIAVFLFDILVSLNTSFYEDGRLQTNQKRIRKNYVKKDLIFDSVSLVAIIFYEIVQSFQLDKTNSKYVLLLFFLRLKQLLKIEGIIIDSFDLNRRIKAVIKLLLLLTKILLICNFVACGAFYLSNYLFEKGFFGKDNLDCGDSPYWIISTCQNGIALRELNFGARYVYSLYWASTTMISIGYGDVTPKNSYQVGYTIFIQFGSCLLYGYAINQIWLIVQELNSKTHKIHTRLYTMNVYMRDKEIGNDLSNRVNGYLNNYYNSKNLRQRDLQAEIISQLTPALKRELYFESYSIILKHRFFNCFHEDVIIEACQFVNQVCCYEDESLTVNDFSSSPCLYYLRKGELRQQTGNKGQIKLQTQYKGDYIRLYQFITQLAQVSELIADKYSLSYYLNFKDWRNALKEEDQIFQYFYYLKERVLIYRQLEKIGYSCYYCSLHSHRSELCFDHFLRNDINKNYELVHRSQELARRHYIRRRFVFHIEQRRFRKKSSNKLELMHHPQMPRERLSSVQFHIKGIDSSLFFQEPHNTPQERKDSSDEEQHIKRGGKFYAKSIHKHDNHKTLEKVRGIYTQRSQFSEDGANYENEIKMQEMDIDELASFTEYYPNYNPSEFSFREKQRKRITKSFAF